MHGKCCLCLWMITALSILDFFNTATLNVLTKKMSVAP